MDSTLCARCGEVPQGEAHLWGDVLCARGNGKLSCYDVARSLVGNDQGAWLGLRHFWALMRRSPTADILELFPYFFSAADPDA
jgi:hypothetical protein